MIFYILYFSRKSFLLKGYIKVIIILFVSFVDLTHYIAYIIKFAFSVKLIKKKLFPSSGSIKSEQEFEEEAKKRKIIWFYGFDIAIIVFLCLYILILLLRYILKSISEGIDYLCSLMDNDYDKECFLHQFNGINIKNFDLSLRFSNLSDKEKNEIIFKKENKEKYKYNIDDDKIDLIVDKINDIRRKKNIPLLKYNKTRYLPDFIINEKTELFFNPDESIYKLSPNLYIFKYPKDEFKNNINNDDIIKIITNDAIIIVTINQIIFFISLSFIFIIHHTEKK